jgi:hypothetical protein
MEVRFVDHDDGTFGFVFDEVLEVGVGRERAGGVVGIANVEESGVGRGGDHGLGVVSIGFRERNFDDSGVGGRGCEHSCFIAGIGVDVASLRRREGDDGEAQRGRGTGKGLNAIRVEAFLLGEGVDEVVGEMVEIASAERDDSGNGFACGLAGAQGILVGVDHDGVFWSRAPGRGGEHGLGDHVEGCGGG